MESGLAIHTAARRYCLEQFALWSERYSEMVLRGADRESDGYHYTADALNTFPRYNVLNAIRVALEEQDSSELGNLETSKDRLIQIGRSANDDFTRRPIGTIDEQATVEEREKFCSFIRRLSLADLSLVEPLPFRRVLAAEEAKALWSRLRVRWQITEDYWYPLADCSLSGVVAFESSAFGESIALDRIKGLLRQNGVDRVWELREYGPEYEQDIAILDPHYNGAEGYWTSGDLSWVIYASHECSITVGGWLLGELIKIWPSWEDRVWTGHF